MAWPTVLTPSISSSGIVTPNSSSRASTASTRSSESASRSSWNRDWGVTLSSGTDRLSARIAHTLSCSSAMSIPILPFPRVPSAVVPLWWSGGEAAVHRDHCAAHIGGLRSREERDDRRHLLGRPEPPDRRHLDVLRPKL